MGGTGRPSQPPPLPCRLAIFCWTSLMFDRTFSSEHDYTKRPLPLHLSIWFPTAVEWLVFWGAEGGVGGFDRPAGQRESFWLAVYRQLTASRRRQVALVKTWTRMLRVKICALMGFCWSVNEWIAGVTWSVWRRCSNASSESVTTEHNVSLLWVSLKVTDKRGGLKARMRKDN